ncbi:MAG: DUF3592 domain-containing protein [Burkholderiales bacterium]|nr:DUF3592 domain-containing protein [Burkholderiales bacterium]
MKSSRTTAPGVTARHRLIALPLWFLLAAIFGLCGWLFGLLPIVTAVGNWQQARDYVATPAQVVQRVAKDGTGAHAAWSAAQYEVNGKRYFAERATVLDDDDPSAANNAQALKALDAARAGNQPITVWVSPRRPEIALLSRDLPLASLWPRLPMALGFPLFALAGLAGMVGALFNPGWYTRLANAAGVWLFAAAWCGFVFPMLLLITSDNPHEWGGVAIMSLFVLVGIGCLWAAIAGSLRGETGTNDRDLSSKGRNVKRGGLGGRGDKFDKN